MQQIDFLFFDAGGGHRAAATALKTVIEQQALPWNVRLVNLQDVLDDYDFIRKLTGIRAQDLYNLVLRKGWTLGSPQMLKLMHGLIRLTHGTQVRVLKQFWSQSKPDLVVSLIPNFGRSVYESLKSAHPDAVLATILTDLADYPPHFWIEARQDQHYICGTGKAIEQAAAMGYGPDRALRVSGMILHPRFYEPVEVDRAAGRVNLKLDPSLPTGLILFGGHGSGEIRRVLLRLDQSTVAAQFIVICGKNESLRQELASRRWRMPVFIEGYTRDVPLYMHLSDFFIGKAGPGSVSEAIAMKLPVIVERNAWTLPQERYNAEWVRQQEVGIVLASFQHIVPAVERLLSGDTLESYKRNAARLDNQAVFEIPPILAQILENRCKK